MPEAMGWSGRGAGLLNSLHARALGHRRIRTAYTRRGEPHLTGSVARGRQLLSGRFPFAGHLVEAAGRSIWDLPQPSRRFTAELHGFTWLDDLSAVGGPGARLLAQDWTAEWVRRYGRGRGPGWTPALTGRRLIRLLDHAELVLGGDRREAALRSFGRQTLFLARRWQAAAPGLPRFEALVGLIHGGLALEGLERVVEPAQRALARECGLRIGAGGTIPSRNPAELAEVFTLLVWASEALTQARRGPGTALASAVERTAPVLRALRQADGALPRFHGGGRGAEGRLERALFLSGVRGGGGGLEMAMGFSRLQRLRTSVVVDTAPPPPREASADGHASTLAFELTSGRRPVIVSCGPGAAFGERWHRAGRATASHSTLAIDGWSSSRIGTARLSGAGEAELLVEGPAAVPVERRQTRRGVEVEASHDGYAATHGLTHLRRVELTHDGRALIGEDSLIAVDPDDRTRFDEVVDRPSGVPFAIRFHLHPGVAAELDQEAAAARLTLPNGEAWLLGVTEGRAVLRIDDSVYLEPALPTPRATRQVVLFCTAVEYSTRVAWALAKTEDTPAVIRDVERGETY